MKKLINLLLLTVMFFSIAHEVVLESDYSTNHCSVKEYISEFDHAITEHHDKHIDNCCKTHFMFHLSFLLPDTLSFFEEIALNTTIEYSLHLNNTIYINNTFRPPIA